jgi:RNA polymerase sigma-70 factor (ECF subfamily)
MQPALQTDSVPDASPQTDERRLITRALAGDREAGRALYDAHVARVYRLVFRLAGDEDLAKDLTQETFIRAFGRLHEFRGDAALGTWLHSIAVSVTLNGMRKERRLRQRETDLDEAPEAYAPATAGDPDLRARLHRAIAGLADIYRTVVIMHDVEGYTHGEIARILGVPEGTSKARLSAARSKLRERLADFMKE